MKRIGRISIYVLLGSFIFIQFFSVDKNSSEEVSPHDFLLVNKHLPDPLKETFRTSCYDCHSDHTNYPWYAHIAPFSWLIGQHIKNGKSHVNFSAYDTLSPRKKIALLDKICEVIGDSSMPPANYLMLHQDAALDFDDITAICDWADGAAFSIMREK